MNNGPRDVDLQGCQEKTEREGEGVSWTEMLGKICERGKLVGVDLGMARVLGWDELEMKRLLEATRPSHLPLVL